MKRLLLLLILVSLLIPLSGCMDKKETFFGEWIVTRPIAYAPIYAMDEKTVKNFVGKKAQYKPGIAEFDGEICANPQYQKTVISDDEFFEGFHIHIKNLGIKAKSIEVVEVYSKEANDWINPGSYLIVKSKNSLITVWDGVFFELERIK